MIRFPNFLVRTKNCDTIIMKYNSKGVMDMFDFDVVKIVGVRLDNRLLHGIVANQWAPYVKCNRILIIDDKVASNELQKELMKICRPANCSISILKEQQAFENLESGKYKGQKILILIRRFDILLHLLQLDLQFPPINIGMYTSANSTIAVSAHVQLNSEEYESLKELEQRNFEFAVQYVPAEKPVKLP